MYRLGRRYSIARRLARGHGALARRLGRRHALVAHRTDIGHRTIVASRRRRRSRGFGLRTVRRRCLGALGSMALLQLTVRCVSKDLAPRTLELLAQLTPHRRREIKLAHRINHMRGMDRLLVARLGDIVRRRRCTLAGHLHDVLR